MLTYSTLQHSKATISHVINDRSQVYVLLLLSGKCKNVWARICSYLQYYCSDCSLATLTGDHHLLARRGQACSTDKYWHVVNQSGADVISFLDIEDLQNCCPISNHSKTKGIQSYSYSTYFISCLWEATERMGNIYFPMPSWRWWHGCHWLLLSHMALHYNGASESKSPRRPRPVCLADRLWCKRLVIGCYSKQDNCLVKDEWRQIGLRRLFPWSASTEWACVSEHKWEVTTRSAPSSSTKGCTDKNTYSDCMVGATPCGRSGQLFSLSVCVWLSACTFLYSFPLPPCPSASVVLVCLVNLCRSPWIFRLTWLTSGVCSIGNSFFVLLDGCSWELIRAPAFVGVSRSAVV